jgi:predicted N-acetyltransferase YhbS
MKNWMNTNLKNEKADAVDIQLLADHADIVPVIACIHLLEMRQGARSNYQLAIDRFSCRLNRQVLPLALVAFADTLPVGTASLVACDLDSYHHLTPWLASFSVAMPYRSLGIGRQLVQQVESIAMHMGYEQLYLYTWTAEKYYHRLGWTVIDTAQPEGLPESIVMQKSLL